MTILGTTGSTLFHCGGCFLSRWRYVVVVIAQREGDESVSFSFRCCRRQVRMISRKRQYAIRCVYVVGCDDGPDAAPVLEIGEYYSC